MSQLFESLKRSGGNFIPSGRQIPRTPPPPITPSEDLKTSTRDPDDGDQTQTHDFCSLEAKTADDPIHMLKGMKGYQLTPGDLEFIKTMKEKQLMKKLGRDLKELEELIKMETADLERSIHSREKAEAELNMFPSCEQLSEWTKVVLRTTSPLNHFTDMDTKSLLSMVKVEDVQHVIIHKTAHVGQMRKLVANKKKKEAVRREQLEKEMRSHQLETQKLTRELRDQESELAQQEACKLNASEKPTKSVQAAGRKQKKFSSPEAVRIPRSRRKCVVTAPATVSQPIDERPSPADQNKVKVEAASKQKRRKKTVDGAGQETQIIGLRRSQRIANKKY